MAHEDPPAHGDLLFTTRWVHLYEQDTAEGEVYAPEDGPIPLSRRPRERLQLDADGSATLFVPGPDDRPSPRPARWTEEQHEVFRTAGAATLRIVRRSSTRMVVKRE